MIMQYQAQGKLDILGYPFIYLYFNFYVNYKAVSTMVVKPEKT